MEWAKSPVVAGSMLCAACLVVATAVPAAPPVAEQPTKAVHAGVNLAVDFSAIDAFSAIPQYQTLVNGSSTPAQISAALTALASLSGIPAFVNFANGGGLAALVPYAALSGLNLYATGNIAGIDAFSTLGATSLGDLASVSAIPVFVGPNGVLTGGGVNALGGYAALSAVDTFVGDNNGEGGVFTGGGIDALAPDADGNGGYAALSALPVFFGRATTDNGTATSFGPGAIHRWRCRRAV